MLGDFGGEKQVISNMSKFRKQLEGYRGFIKYGFLIPKFAYKILQVCVAPTQLQTIFVGMKEPRTIHCRLLEVGFVQNNTPTAVDFSGNCVKVTHSFSSVRVPSSGSTPVPSPSRAVVPFPQVFAGLPALCSVSVVPLWQAW